MTLQLSHPRRSRHADSQPCSADYTVANQINKTHILNGRWWTRVLLSNVGVVDLIGGSFGSPDVDGPGESWCDLVRHKHEGESHEGGASVS